MNRNMLKGGLAGCAVAVLAGQALGAVIAYEGFAYPAATPLPAMGGCCGWAAPWVGSGAMVALPPSLNYPLALPPTGIALQNTAVGEAWRTLPAGVNNIANDLWVSWIEMTSVVGTTAFVSLDTPAAGPGVQVFKDAGGLVSATVGGPMVPVGPSRGPGNPDFFVVRLRQFAGSTVVDVYLNPTAPLPTAAPSVSLAMPAPVTLGRYYYRSDAGQWLDEIRIGTLPGDVAAGAVSPCYANCDGSTTSPCLNVLDFACFLNRYAAGDPYANCDGSTTPPVLNVLDFACFLNTYAAGCSAC